ncbi:MAG: PRC-barrel domain-containing protein [Dehalococcoidia bacterium]
MQGRDANELLSMPVIAITEGKELGRVKDVLFDPAEHALLGVMVSPAGGMNGLMFLERAHIRAIGDNAITVRVSGVLDELASRPRAQEIIDSGLHLRGTPVVTETGNSLGTVDKILIDDGGNITAYHASSGLLGFGDKTDIMPHEVVSIGDDAIIVMASAERRADSEDDKTDASTAGSRAMGNGDISDEPASSDEVMRGNDPQTFPPPTTTA